MVASSYVRKWLVIALCVLVPATQYACTKHALRTLERPGLDDPRERQVPPNGKITQIVLKSGEQWTFDENGAVFCHRDHSICGTREDGEFVTIDVSDVERVTLSEEYVERSLPTLIAVTAVMVGLAIGFTLRTPGND